MDELVKIAQESETEGIGEEDTRNKRKVLIFSYYADTVGWIYDHLQEVVETDERLTAYRGRVASLTGSAGHSDEGGVGKRDVLWGFAPKTTGAPSGSDEDLYDIVVATDVLAEGVNLQQARHIINYDLPWNPMRLVQRHGRIDRIGSPHQEVFIRCVFPDAKLDNLLGLHERIRRKLRQAAVSVGVESDVIPKEPGAERVFTETREEIERLRREEAGIFEQAGYGRGALSGEEFRRELEKALEDPLPKEQVTSLPWGSGSGMAIAASSAAWQTGSDKTPPPAAGFVFCARVGDHDRVQFRYVEVDASGQVLNRVRSDADDASTGLTSDTLTCLANARPEADWKTERVLSDETHQLAYAAWAEAARDIEDAWRKGTDKKSFEPELAKAQRDAIKVLQDHAPEGLDLAGADAAVEKLQARLTQHRVRVLQTALKSKSDSPTEQAVEVLRVIEELGLERDIPPEPLPEITSDDVHLICWLALTPPAD
ncbi:MAG TPA: hypothetical protein DEP69_03050 [Acidimicrobiaceae bacterium]|nr:hypothetical protein [Acidimicrobiaceae bacterium]